MLKLQKEDKLTEEDKNVITRFIDAFITCSVQDESVKDIV